MTLKEVTATNCTAFKFEVRVWLILKLPSKNAQIQLKTSFNLHHLLLCTKFKRICLCNMFLQCITVLTVYLG